MSYIFQFLLILALVFFGCIKVTLQGSASRRYLRGTQDSVLFTGVFFLSVAILLAIIFRLGSLSGEMYLWAIAEAVCSVMFQFLYSLALGMGPVSLTVLITNFGVFISTFASAALFSETIYITQLLGMVLLVVSMVLSVKRSAGERPVSRKWFLLAMVGMCANGSATVIQKVASMKIGTDSDGADNTFLFVMYISGAAILFAAYSIGMLAGKKEKCTFGRNPRVFALAAGMGLSIAIYQRIMMEGLASIDGAFMFPTYAGLSSLGMSVIGIVLFGDKLSLRQKLGIACGILCVVCMNLRLGFAVT